VESRFDSNDIVRLRRNRLLLALPLLVLMVGLLVVRLRMNVPDDDVMERVPRTLLEERVGQPIELKQAQDVGKRVFEAWKNAPEPPEVRRRHSSLAHAELVIALSVTLAIGIWQLNPFPRRRRGRLIAENGALEWEGERFVSRDDLVQGVLRPGWGGVTILRLERKGHLPLAHEIEVRDGDEGRKILWALGLDASQRTATFFVSSLARTHRLLKYGLVGLRLAVLVFAGFVAIQLGRLGLFHERAAFGLALLVFLIALWMLRRWPVRVRVGTDGVLQEWLWMRRFVPYANVERLERFEWGVRLLVRDAAPLELTVFRVSFLVPKKLVERVRSFPRWLTVRRDLLAQRIEDAMSAREGRASMISVPAWMKRMREEEPSAVDRETLTSILEDPWADAEARKEAARTLAPSKDYLSALADASAHPEFRDALRALADRRS